LYEVEFVCTPCPEAVMPVNPNLICSSGDAIPLADQAVSADCGIGGECGDGSAGGMPVVWHRAPRGRPIL
jgi:hypothetical protein